MKQVIIGDTHGTRYWEKIVEVEKDADRFIFVGDYFDSFDQTGIEQLQNFLDIIRFKKESKKEVILLIGNHDHHYIVPLSFNQGYSGFQYKMYPQFHFALNENLKYLQVCFADEYDTIYSHAGITESWLEEAQISTRDTKHLVKSINELYITKPRLFNFYDGDHSGYGQHVKQSPLWVRPQSLYDDKVDQFQVVGHTTVKKTAHPPKEERRGFYLVDALPKYYLTRVDKEFKIIKTT